MKFDASMLLMFQIVGGLFGMLGGITTYVVYWLVKK